MDQICKRCILDSTFPRILFDKDGICNYCKNYEFLNNKYALNENNQGVFFKMIEKIKKTESGKEYDCIQGVSGGRDSTYCLYLLKKWGLRPLAVHFDNNMDSKIASENIKKACTKLEIDLHTFVIDWEEYKDLQIAFLKASVPSVDTPLDQAFVSVLYDFAYKNDIKYIFDGYTFRGEGVIPREWSLNTVPFIMDIHNKFGSKRLQKYPLRKISDLIKYRISGMTLISPLNYIDYNYAETMPLLEKELGWKYYGGHHFESIFTRWAFAFYLPKKFGIDKRVSDYSTLIRSGQLSRDEALTKIKEQIYTPEQEKEDRRYIMNKLEITNQEMENILNASPKLNSDYKDHSRVFKLINMFVGPIRF